MVLGFNATEDATQGPQGSAEAGTPQPTTLGGSDVSAPLPTSSPTPKSSLRTTNLCFPSRRHLVRFLRQGRDSGRLGGVSTHSRDSCLWPWDQHHTRVPSWTRCVRSTELD